MIKKLGIGCGGLFLLLIVIGVATSGSRPTTTGPTLAPAQAQTSTPAAAAAATTAPTPAPTATPTPRPTPLILQGQGQFVTEPITVSTASNVLLTHSGSGNFIVYQVQGTNRQLLVNRIGRYEGIRPLWAANQTADPFRIQIEANGPWTATITAVECCATDAAFVGAGDRVSTTFNIPADRNAPWQFTHDGRSNFIVHLHCRNGSSLVQNRIGAFEGSLIVPFGQDWCIWDVRADGNWSMRPR